MQYWYKICPVCKQGILIICINDTNNNPFFHCNECELAWNNEKDIGTNDDVFNGYDIESHTASLAEIKSNGWHKYALHEFQKTRMTLEEYEEWKKNN